MVDSPKHNGSDPKRILVADDEHLIASGLASNLQSLGFEVLGPVGDGKQAIDLAAEQVPDLALLDIRMPGTDGLAAAAQIWDQYGIPSVIVSAYSDRAYIEQAQATGVFGYLLKPVSKSSLQVAISIAWSRASHFDGQKKRIAQLERTLNERRTVEQAKWKLVEGQGLTEAEAHTLLQRAARSNRRRLCEVAQEVIDGGALPAS